MAFEHDVEALTTWHPSAVARCVAPTARVAVFDIGGGRARELPRYLPGGVYASATLAAFSAMPLNSLDVHARTVSIFESESLAAAAIEPLRALHQVVGPP